MVRFLTIAVFIILGSCAPIEKDVNEQPLHPSSLEALPLLHIQPEVFELGDIKEDHILTKNFSDCDEMWLINSVRKWVTAILSIDDTMQNDLSI